MKVLKKAYWRATYIFGLMSVLGSRLFSMDRSARPLFASMIFILLACVAGYFASDNWTLLLVPFGLLAFGWGINDYRLLYLAIWATLPFAIEIDLPGGLSTDFPDELFMWMCCLLFPVYLFLHHKEMDFRFIFHPLFILLTIHFFWIIFTSATSTVPLISFKYTLAKSWYLLCFIVIPLLAFREIKDFKTWGLVLVIPLVLSILVVLARHSQYGFTFSTVNKAIIPIYRNHVDYACCLGITLPFVWFMRGWFEQKRIRHFFMAALVIMLIGIYFSYTRAAWLCVPLSIGIYIVIRLRLMRAMVPFALAGGLLIVGYLAYDNNYINFSPDFEKTITQKNFGDLVSATYSMEDISTVERFYRWVAGYYMIQEKPWLGFGPSSFYSAYHSYVDRHFTTYVSDNPEHSGMHNYYLMTAVEQGLIGLAIFLVLILFVLLYGENLYHRLAPGPLKELLAAALISFGCNLFILTLNDTVETDKLGTFFFLCMAIVLWIDMKERKTISVTSIAPKTLQGGSTV